ncbi:Glyoxylase, beta-lactamase superfamily II [Nitrosomonas cryotolerans]|uniref:Glyoxylase, beta-lactamase superfamily II n=1 Tax=Nitrosomonas cryotolerans ATCC 49181 TaxID=1131553 RepID=A0A1N6J8P6_9PROT|nr:MBL fold metallo-hydrolase [Nitrosomonas cryotolerans]SFP44201.1 Glyoxylase, beta-lactamase superfamily II [Nitrosomonas cryotolerans]SIO40724.1 Glyoxylase, beta-lactamase superfamily II [Nitrosomonas cryotolerans ATCC 49181]
MSPNINAFYDSVTCTVSYIVFDEPGGSGAIIDPVLDYDPKSSRTHTLSADKLIEFIKDQRLTLKWILETHAHADHLSSADYLKSQLNGYIAISNKIPAVQKTFKKIFNLGNEFIPDGRHFDYLFSHNERFQVGKLNAKAISVSGHTPADMVYQFGDALFIGDTLFMPDIGTARADFPGGDANQLFLSIRNLLEYPPETRLFMCHDYPPENRAAQWESTVEQQRMHNIHVHDGISEDEFVAMRRARDTMLDMPTLLLPSIQTNIRAGKMPPAETNGVAYFKIPINLL